MVDKEPPQNEPLLVFPCDFTIKVFGLANDQFPKKVYELVHSQATDFKLDNMTSRASGNGKYLALSLKVHVESKEQLDKIYELLSSQPDILMAL